MSSDTWASPTPALKCVYYLFEISRFLAMLLKGLNKFKMFFVIVRSLLPGTFKTSEKKALVE